MVNRRKSGLEDVPNIVSRPVYKDRFIWFGILAAVFWLLVLYWLFF